MLLRLVIIALPLLLLMANVAHARPDTVAQYVEAVMTQDTATLQKILAENFLHIGSNGLLQDKENYIENLKNGKMDIRRLTVSDVVSSHYGSATLLTGNAVVHGTYNPPLPQGLMRFSMVLERVGDQDKIILSQLTPVKSLKNSKKKK
ncbi:MAG: nuclear transport factor 2 family protein [Desulfovibrionaceae bacterium]